jgi:hypothetical protein
VGLAWIRTLQHTRAKGVLLKSNGPLKYSQADIFGLIVAWRSRLTVNLAWGRSRSQRYGRNAASTPARMKRKWFLKCSIIFLALFHRCMSGGTSWNLVFHDSVMTHLKSALASLSLILRSTDSPRAATYSMMVLNAGMQCLLAKLGARPCGMQSQYIGCPSMPIQGSIPCHQYRAY